MKKSLATLSLAVMTIATISDAFAGYYTTRCHYRTGRWGHTTRVCRQVYVRTHNDDVADAVIIGAAAGAVAGALATTCAPEVVNGNVEATQNILSDIAKSPEFEGADKFTSLVNAIESEKNVEKKINAYFSLVGVESTEDMAYFVGARDEELADYAEILATNTELSNEQANIVAKKLSSSLRGGLR